MVDIPLPEPDPEPWCCPEGHRNLTQTWCERCGRDYEEDNDVEVPD